MGDPGRIKPWQWALWVTMQLLGLWAADWAYFGMNHGGYHAGRWALIVLCSTSRPAAAVRVVAANRSAGTCGIREARATDDPPSFGPDVRAAQAAVFVERADQCVGRHLFAVPQS